MPNTLTSLVLSPIGRFSQNTLANLRAVMHMLLGSTKAFLWIRPTIKQFLFFASLALAANVLFGWLVADTGSLFNKQGLVSYLIWPLVTLVAGVIIAQRSHNPALVLVPSIFWLMADACIALLQSVIQYFGQKGWLPAWSYDQMPIIFLLLFIWQTVALLWIFARKLGWPWWERLIIFITTAAVLTVWQSNVSSQPIWKAQKKEHVITEEAFYAQPTLLNEQLLSLQSGIVGTNNWYFLGVAGAGYDDVFEKEVMQVKRLFDVRFGTFGRSLALVNNPNTLLSEPIASQYSIKQSLQRIGQLMNPDEDVLFLLLSSHGLPNILQLENAPITLKNISPQWLKQTLDQSGIRWRVIVVSSCYSGSFIADLQSPNTLVITASAADKASFGCGGDEDYTYFGRAFFAQSLRENSQLLAAFDTAKTYVSQREHAMGFPSSEPKIYVGEAMKTMLPVFEKSLLPPERIIQQSITAINNDKAQLIP